MSRPWAEQDYEMSLLRSFIKAVGPLLPDSAVALGVREYFNSRHGAWGTMTALRIDTKNKKAALDLELKGETLPLNVNVERYELTTVGDKTFIEIVEINTSREWVNVLARDFLQDKKFEVPEAVRAIL